MTSSSPTRAASLDQIIAAAVQEGSMDSLCNGHDQGATYLLRAVRSNQTKIVLILLQHGANPNYNRLCPGKEYFSQWRENPRHTDRAIDHGNVEMLSLLLAYDAHVGDCNTKIGTSLNNLLLYKNKSRDIKLAICRMLVNHAKKEEMENNNHNGTSIFLQTTLEQAFVLNGKSGCEILLEAGVEPHGTVLLYRTIRKNAVDICQLLLQYGANPFLQEFEEQVPIVESVKTNSTTNTSNRNNNNSNNNNSQSNTATTPLPTVEPHCSPFHAAACLTDTSFLDLFLKQWDSTHGKQAGGKNGDIVDGEHEYSPLQILYHVDVSNQVSLEAVKLIVAHACHADALMKVAHHGEYGLYPLHSAAMWNARLDVIFLLLKHWPSALLIGQRQHQQLPVPSSSPPLPK